MTWKGWLVILGAAGVTAVTGGCKDDDLRTYLGSNGRMAKWQDHVGKAICQLEVNSPNSAALDQAKRICPQGEGGPNDNTTAPRYPPAQ